MPHADLIQGDFSNGEVTARAQGDVIDEEMYRKSVSRMANVMPTRARSFASRAGGKFMLQGIDGDGLLTNIPVQHVSVPDSPIGDIVIEVGAAGMMRLLDRNCQHGPLSVLPWNFTPPSQLVQFVEQDAAWAYGNKKSRTVYLSDDGTSVRSYYLTQGSGGFNAIVSRQAALPAGTTEQWTLSCFLAGDNVTMTVVQSPSGNTQSFVLAAGANSANFTPNIGGPLEDFYIRLDSVGSVAAHASVMWEPVLTKNGAITVVSTSGLVTPSRFNGAYARPVRDRVRAASFWLSADHPYKGDPATFWVAFAGGDKGKWAGTCLSWTQSGTAPGIWTFIQLPCAPGSLPLIQGSSTVAAYQDRLWFGNNLAAGRPQVIASVIGFMQVFNSGMDATGADIIPQAATLTFGTILNHWFVFKVVKETYTVKAGDLTSPTNVLDAGGAVIGTVVQFSFHLPVLTPLPDPPALVGGVYMIAAPVPAPALSVTQNGNSLVVQPAIPHTLPTTSLPVAESAFVGVQAAAPIGSYSAGVDNPLAIAPTGIVLFEKSPKNTIHTGDTLVFSTIAQATDPLNLTLASPTGGIAYLSVLRGLMLGTSRGEKLFSQNTPLSVDSASGQSFSLDDESNVGADLSLPALEINDKVLFVQRGRKVIRWAGLNIYTNGGLVAEDIGALGEHLLLPRVRALCYLKTPVPRVVFAMDDGTGAVMTIKSGNTGFSWARFTLPAMFGGIYSLASLEGEYGSELWVGTENGMTLWWDSLESDIETKQLDETPAGVTLAPVHYLYDVENPLPPVMDGWFRLPVKTGTQYATGLDPTFINQSVYVYVNGQVYGPLTVVSDPIGSAPHPGKIDLSGIPGLGTTWVDAGGSRRGQEVYAGLAYPEHRIVTLPVEGGNPGGTSQAMKSRRVQCYVRFVDSYLPLVGGKQAGERGANDPMDFLGKRVTGDVRVTQGNWSRANTLEISMVLPLRLEVSAIFGGVQENSGG